MTLDPFELYKMDKFYNSNDEEDEDSEEEYEDEDGK